MLVAGAERRDLGAVRLADARQILMSSTRSILCLDAILHLLGISRDGVEPDDAEEATEAVGAVGAASG
jgi:hypothetical protein